MTFVLDGKTFEWPVSVNGGAGFEAGYKYTYTATLSTENGKPAVTMGGASIESWTDQPGGDINVDLVKVAVRSRKEKRCCWMRSSIQMKEHLL